MKFLRHATCWFTFGEKNVILDPFFMPVGYYPPIPGVASKERNPLKPLPLALEKLPGMDLILVTHPHFDHFDPFAANLLSKETRLILPESGKKKVKKYGYQNVEWVRFGKTIFWEFLKITSVVTRSAERLSRWLPGEGVGYIIENTIAKKYKTIYISGDTILFNGLIDQLKNYAIDCAILCGGGARLPVFGRHTFSNAEIVSFVNQTRANETFVIHLETLNHCTETTTDLLSLIQATSGSRKAGPGFIRPLLIGEEVHIEN